MQASVVMMMALSGLGCQNKSCDASVAPAGYDASGQCAATHVHAGSVAPSGYPANSAGHSLDNSLQSYTLHSSIRSTLWSFVLGHDPDGVPTVAEIEASLASGAYNTATRPSGH
jgi:hypothetical protein